MGRSWTNLQKSTILAIGTAVVPAADTLDTNQGFHIKAATLLMLGSRAFLPHPTLNGPLGSVNLAHSTTFHSSLSSPSFSMDSPMKTMFSVFVNQAAVSQFNHHALAHVNCNVFPMFQNLGSTHASKICPENTLLGPKTTSYNPRSFLCPHLAALSGYCSCLQSLSNKSAKWYAVRTTHRSISCPCLCSMCQFQSQGLKHHCASELPHFEVWLRTNATTYLNPLSVYSFHLGSSDSFNSSKLSPLASLFSSVMSPFLFSSILSQPFSSSPHGIDSKSFHVWHSPRIDGDDNDDESFSLGRKSVMAVVLLGWLGAEQKHLSRYADWYTARGIHAVTFVVPMKDLLSFKPGGRVEQRIEILAQELAHWMSEKENNGRERCIMFHTFSNTGWLTYGVILEKLIKRDDLYEKIKGCVIDSAPEPEPNPQVWASGFSTAFLKKRSALLHSALDSHRESSGLKHGNGKLMQQIEPPLTEAALLAVLEKFFSIMLKLPYVNERLSKVTSILSENQPPCPQLYIYSTADRVIPAESVESFIDEQKKTGRKVRACNMKSSPHVDHFRSFPDIYSEQLQIFLKECTQIVGQ